jgi:hypothetical protein
MKGERRSLEVTVSLVARAFFHSGFTAEMASLNLSYVMTSLPSSYVS